MNLGRYVSDNSAAVGARVVELKECTTFLTGYAALNGSERDSYVLNRWKEGGVGRTNKSSKTSKGRTSETKSADAARRSKLTRVECFFDMLVAYQALGIAPQEVFMRFTEFCENDYSKVRMWKCFWHC
jgi:hypothetical protein